MSWFVGRMKVTELQKQMEALLAIHREKTDNAVQKQQAPTHSSEFRVSVNITGENPIHQPEPVFIPPASVPNKACEGSNLSKLNKNKSRDEPLIRKKKDNRPEVSAKGNSSALDVMQEECSTGIRCTSNERCIDSPNPEKTTAPDINSTVDPSTEAEACQAANTSNKNKTNLQTNPSTDLRDSVAEGKNHEAWHYCAVSKNDNHASIRISLLCLQADILSTIESLVILHQMHRT